MPGTGRWVSQSFPASEHLGEDNDTDHEHDERGEAAAVFFHPAEGEQEGDPGHESERANDDHHASAKCLGNVDGAFRRLSSALARSRSLTSAR
jgi:hypothetical protein